MNDSSLAHTMRIFTLEYFKWVGTMGTPQFSITPDSYELFWTKHAVRLGARAMERSTLRKKAMAASHSREQGSRGCWLLRALWVHMHGLLQIYLKQPHKRYRDRKQTERDIVSLSLKWTRWARTSHTNTMHYFASFLRDMALTIWTAGARAILLWGCWWRQ